MKTKVFVIAIFLSIGLGTGLVLYTGQNDPSRRLSNSPPVIYQGATEPAKTPGEREKKPSPPNQPEKKPEWLVQKTPEGKKESAPPNLEKAAGIMAKDRGSQLLSKLLPPSGQVAALPLPGTNEPRRLAPSGNLQIPRMPPTLNEFQPVRLPLPLPAKPIQPRVLPEGPPLSRLLFEPAVPDRPVLPAVPGLRLPSFSTEQPPPLPILAQVQADRVPLDDPTREASLEAALSGPPPVRTNPAPFLRLNLPDPYENRTVAELRNPPPENPAPVIATIQAPRK